ncbi:MAG: transporter ATP-binding protein [Glaciihabitans sp.]|nr:transporter ATP-binding protein [Glaciihabitans sp.]
MNALITASTLRREYRLPRQDLFTPGPLRHALAGIDLEVNEHESLAIIGESGSGKSTLVRLLLALDTPTAGSITYRGRPVTPGSARSLHWLRRDTGIVFQDPYASLDPRMSARQIVAEPLRALNIAGNHRSLVNDILHQVGLDPDHASRYPHEFSGGQRQRIALARALVHKPSLLVGDEPLSALDVTVRAQILELLARLRRELDLTLVLVSHDIGLVQHLSDRVLVMKDGGIVEQGTTHAVLHSPTHPYTRSLLDAVPTLLPGSPPGMDES